MNSPHLKILRIKHWTKNSFLAFGFLFALLLETNKINLDFWDTMLKSLEVFLALSFASSANYALNELLDAKSDKLHPIKKHRPIPNNKVPIYFVFSIYIFLASLAFLITYSFSHHISIVILSLLLQGLVYNVKPIRTKDIPILDVISESINNPIRFYAGWFILTNSTQYSFLPAIYSWILGGFLMSFKRLVEFRFMNNPKIAKSYRKSFDFYNEKRLITLLKAYLIILIFFTYLISIKYSYLGILIVLPFIFLSILDLFKKILDETNYAQKGYKYKKKFDIFKINKKLKKFEELPDFKSKTILLDIDGTLVPEKGEHLPKKSHNKLIKLKKNNTLYFATNSESITRNKALSKRYGIKIINARYRKPSKKVLRVIKKTHHNKIVVIGDKLLIDGIWAWRIKATFIKIQRKTNNKENLFIKLSYLVDDLFFYIVHYS